MSSTHSAYRALFGNSKPVIGMIHLKALPGAPDYDGDLAGVLASALADAQALIAGGIEAIMIENFYDSPFFQDQVGPETVAAMSHIITHLRGQTSLPLGVNVLRNDGKSALAIATACQCQFVRINQLAWASVTDQGIIQGRAAEIARYRRLIGASAIIFADCLTKHAVPLAPQAMADVARDTWERAGASALVISGAATGHATEVSDVLLARQSAPQAPLLIGSGITLENLEVYLPHVDGFLVGTWFKEGGAVEAPVDPSRVAAMLARKKTLHQA
jgi:uncharacterized protein